MYWFTEYHPDTGRFVNGGGVILEQDVPTGPYILPVKCDPRTQMIDIETLEVIAIPPVVKTLDELKTEAKAFAAAKRYEVENGGVYVYDFTQRTDDRAKTLLSEAAAYAEANPAYVARWKTDEGEFVDVPASVLIQLRDTVFAHVRAAFLREDAFRGMISACTTAEEVAALYPTMEQFWP